MNKHEIQKILPHRDDMLLIDRAEVRDNKAYGEKHINGDEYFLRGHFPENPVVPGVILCEILAQSACVLLQNEMDKSGANALTLLTGLDKVRFKKQVKPGDTICTECEIIRKKPPFYFASGKAFVNNEICISAEFSFALLENGRKTGD